MRSKFWLVLLFFIYFIGEKQAMAKIYLFSEVQGVVMNQGKPVVGAVVEQQYFWHWKSERGQTEVKTDAEGKFTFPAIIKSSLMASVLPHEPFIEQTILIKQEDNTYKAWMFDKRDYEKNGELEGKSIFIDCNLQNQLSHKGKIYGICELR
jgi:hypothetical protein